MIIKKIFIISSILLLLVLVFFGIYNFAFSDINNLKNKENPSFTEENSMKGEQNNKKIYSLSDDPVVGPVIDDSGTKIKYYNKNNGNVSEVTLDGSIGKVIFENDLNNLRKAVWSSNKNFVITSFGDGINDKFYLYSYITRKSTELKGGIDDVIWDNQGEKIIYKYFDKNSGERTLNISDPNGSNWKVLTALDDKFNRIKFSHVPQTLFASYWNYPNFYNASSLNKISLIEDGNKEEIISGKFGADYLWSPNGRKILISSVDTSSKKLKLEIGDSDGSNLKDLSVPTMVDKCIWSNNGEEIFCAMPLEIPNDSIMPNDYQEGKIKTKDTFWKIDANSGKKERIIELEDLSDNFDAYNLFLSPNEDILFFINKYDDKLYGLII